MSEKANRDIAIAILAGGQARRMGGGDKCLLPIGGEPILRHILNRLGDDYPLAINANDNVGDNANGTAEARFGEFGLPIFSDRDDIPAGAGPLAGILSAMGFFASYRAVLVVAGDVPFIPTDLVERFTASGKADIIFATSYGRRHPVVSLWNVGLRKPLHKALADGIRKVEDFSEKYAVQTVDFSREDGFDYFFNVNNADDLIRAEELQTKK